MNHDALRLRLLLLLLGSLTLVLPAAAQNAGRVPGMVGRTLMGDPNERQPGIADGAADIIRGAAQAKVGKSELAGSLLSARLAFRGAKTETDRLRAAAQLHEALDGKDAVFYVLHVVFGTSDAARRAVDGMHAMTGGIPDDGIVEGARPAYFAWVDGLRASLGLRSTDERLTHVTRDGFLEAQARNKPLHDQYVALRNVAEVRRAAASADAGSIWTTAVGSYVLTPEVMAAGRREATAVAAAAQVAGSGLMLARYDVRAFMPRHLDGRRRPGAEMENLVLAERNAGQKVIQCFYGPTEIVNGQPQYRVYTFWHGAVPASFDRLKADPSGALGGAGPFDRLGQRRARTECPAAEGQVDDDVPAAATPMPAPAAPKPPAEVSVTLPYAHGSPQRFEQSHYQYHPTQPSDPADRKAALELLDRVRSDGQRVLRCSYGPVGSRRSGNSSDYIDVLFWQATLPRQHAELMRLIPSWFESSAGVHNALPRPAAIRACPATLAEAQALAR